MRQLSLSKYSVQIAYKGSPVVATQTLENGTYMCLQSLQVSHSWPSVVQVFLWYAPSSIFPWSFLCQFSLHGPVSDGCRLNEGDGHAIVIYFTETEVQRE